MGAMGTRSIFSPPSWLETDLRGIAHAEGPAVAWLAPGHEPHGQVRYLWTDRLSPELLANDGFRTPCPPVALYSLPQVELRSDWMPYAEGGLICDEAIYPTYVRSFYESGAIDLFGYPQNGRVRRVLAPTYVVTHFNMRTYGHFLLEVLPKLLLIRELYRLGLRYRIAFPKSLGHFEPMLRTACPGARLLIYDDKRENLLLRRALLPGMLVSSTSHLHDLFTSTLRLLGLESSTGAEPRRRVFITREGLRSFRTLRNEAELAAAALDFGFEVVRPEAMAWPEQVRMFRSASHVVGEFSSALHGTMFSPAGTKVVCFHWLGPVQSAIAASLGHQIGYILPREGGGVTFTPGWTETQNFDIDPQLFRDRLSALPDLG